MTWFGVTDRRAAPNATYFDQGDTAKVVYGESSCLTARSSLARSDAESVIGSTSRHPPPGEVRARTRDTTIDGVPPGRAAADLRRFAARTANYVERRARTVSHRLLRDTGAVVDPDAEQAEVLVYFPEPPLRLYQLAQWLPVLERLAEERATACVVRSAGAHPQLREATSLPLAVLPSYSDLMTFYDRGRPKVLLYVNHGQLNFQSLTLQTALHVQISHGESDKRSSVSNQAKAYDRVFGSG